MTDLQDLSPNNPADVLKGLPDDLENVHTMPHHNTKDNFDS